MKNLKPSAAFAAGLWVGAIVAGAAGWLWWESAHTSATTDHAVATADAEQHRQQLRADNARLAAENERLRQTLSFYQGESEESSGPATSPSPGPATGDKKSTDESAASLVQWEARAMQNDLAAVTALGDAIPQDQGEALLRVWDSGQLDLPGQRTAAWYLGTTLEANPKIAAAVRALFADAEADPELWLSALDGLATRSPITTDYHSRVDLLVELEETAAPSLRPQIEATRKQLLRSWADAERAPVR